MRPSMIAIVMLASACGADTGGELVGIRMALEAEIAQEDGSFITRTGFRVVLQEARLAVDSVLAYAPQDVRSSSLRAVVLGRALAHGGYDPFNGRRVRAEYSGPLAIDLLSRGPTALGVLQAESGEIDSATLIFGELPETSAQAWTRGVATRGEQIIEFEGALRLEDAPLLRRVDGIMARGEIREGGSLIVRIRPALWFDEAHFDRLTPSPDGPRPIAPDSQVHTAWLFGTRSSKTYEATWQGP